MASVQEFRTFYARFVVARAGVTNERIVQAFATVERERFVGPGPWSVFTGSRYVDTGSDDPRLLYQDIVVGLAPERSINNGEPSLHARCLAACDTAPGDRVVHVGAGTGYYSAILAALVGPSGHVTAYEIEPDLAARANANLSGCLNVTVMAASATNGALPPADVIYVSAGATHPVRSWLDALKLGGRLVLPLNPDAALGVILRVRRRSDLDYSASVVCHGTFIPCIGARDGHASASLAAALATKSVDDVRSLRLDTTPDATAWCVGDGWWLSTG